MRSPCDLLDDRYLCIRSELSHLVNPEHARRVANFLARRGVRRAGDLIRRYGIQAANAVALDIEAKELEGHDWKEGLERPAAWLHHTIKVTSEQLSLWRDV